MHREGQDKRKGCQRGGLHQIKEKRIAIVGSKEELSCHLARGEKGRERDRLDLGASSSPGEEQRLSCLRRSPDIGP